MKILFAAGGTGGHINPALAVAGEIRERYPDAEILFVGAKGKMETKLVPNADFELKTIRIAGFQRKISVENIIRNILAVWYLLTSSSAVKKIIKGFSPDVVVGFGGYVSGPVLRMAAKMGIPTAIHEQNAFPGVTNKTLAKTVDRVMLTTGDAEKYLQCKNPPVVTGLPVRGEMLKADRDFSRAEMGVSDNEILVLSMGGSLGAATINTAMTKLIASHHKDESIRFLHAMGQYGLWVPEKLKEMGVDTEKAANVEIREYISDMDICMSAADVVICRAGASSLSELQALGKASILIPSPNVAENHQYHNAMALVNRGAAYVIEEKALTDEKMDALFCSLVNDKAKRNEMEQNAKAMAVFNAKEQIADIVVSLIK